MWIKLYDFSTGDVEGVCSAHAIHTLSAITQDGGVT